MKKTFLIMGLLLLSFASLADEVADSDVNCKDIFDGTTAEATVIETESDDGDAKAGSQK